MGIKNSKNFKKFGKHTVAPANGNAATKSTNPFEQDDDDDNTTTQQHQTESITKADSCSAIFSPQFYTPRPSMTGNIIDDDENSIMHRSSEVYSAGKRNVIHDHLNHLNQCTFRRNPPKTNTKYQMHRHSSNSNYGNRATVNVTNLYHRFGGSIQNLVSSNRSSLINNSASDGNLNRVISNGKYLSNGGGSNTANRLSTNSSDSGSDYCPSVMFNRLNVMRQKSDKKLSIKRNGGYNGRNATISKWKQFLNVNLLRKRKENINNNSRKT